MKWASVLLIGSILSSLTAHSATAAATTAEGTVLQNTSEFCGENAYKHCAALCDIGPRPSGSEGYRKQLEYLTSYLEQYGWTVSQYSFKAPNGVPMTNLHAVYGKSQSTRPIILTCHIDTKTGISDNFVGADDGASGASVILEAARIMAQEPETAEHVELIFFDGEESFAYRMTETDGLYGSRADVKRRGTDLPEYQINLDMVGARNKKIAVPIFDVHCELLDIYEQVIDELEYDPLKWDFADESYWDDDLPYREAGVKTINLICKFVNSMWWHTPRDNMSRICPKSLKESGYVALAMIRRLLVSLKED